MECIRIYFVIKRSLQFAMQAMGKVELLGFELKD